MQQEFRILGLMSGSSLDGLDLAYCKFVVENSQLISWELLAQETMAFSEQWQVRLRDIAEQSALIFAKTDVYFGYYMAELVVEFRARHGIGQIDAIASHGHTVFHDPARQITVQIGSGAALSARTGCDVISDFRMQDVAAGGQGAPLAPMADRFLFGGRDFYLNLGGIANLTAIIGDKTIGFDVCYANQVLNILAQKLGFPFDNGGILAKSGQVQPELLEALKNLAFFRKRYPKSLGNEWVREEAIGVFARFEVVSPVDMLATATEHIAFELAKAIHKVIQLENIAKNSYKMLVTGGGAHNSYLLERLAAMLAPNINLELGAGGLVESKEAILMALLGALRLAGLPNMPSATGATMQHSAGALYRYN